jgi:cytochrome c-type biogenesis protein CcmH/NrfG
MRKKRPRTQGSRPASGNGTAGGRLPSATAMASPNRIEALLQFLEEDPTDPFIRFALGQEYLKAGEVERAASFWERLAVDQPEYVGTYYHLGKLYERLGRTADAIGTYERGIRMAGQQRDPHARAELQDALLQARGLGDEAFD